MQGCLAPMLACVAMNGGAGIKKMNGPRVKLLDILAHPGPNGAQAHPPFACDRANCVTLIHDTIRSHGYSRLTYVVAKIAV